MVNHLVQHIVLSVLRHQLQHVDVLTVVINAMGLQHLCIKVYLLKIYLNQNVMILVGDILKRHPATDIKSGNGYNTPTARKSQEHWNYAQSIAPNNFISLGKVLGVVEIILSIGMFLLQISVNIALTVGICTGIVFLFCGFYKTEIGIKNKFKE